MAEKKLAEEVQSLLLAKSNGSREDMISAVIADEYKKMLNKDLPDEVGKYGYTSLDHFLASHGNLFQRRPRGWVATVSELQQDVVDDMRNSQKNTQYSRSIGSTSSYAPNYWNWKRNQTGNYSHHFLNRVSSHKHKQNAAGAWKNPTVGARNNMVLSENRQELVRPSDSQSGPKTRPPRAAIDPVSLVARSAANSPLPTSSRQTGKNSVKPDTAGKVKLNAGTGGKPKPLSEDMAYALMEVLRVNDYCLEVRKAITYIETTTGKYNLTKKFPSENEFLRNLRLTFLNQLRDVQFKTDGGVDYVFIDVPNSSSDDSFSDQEEEKPKLTRSTPPMQQLAITSKEVERKLEEQMRPIKGRQSGRNIYFLIMEHHPVLYNDVIENFKVIPVDISDIFGVNNFILQKDKFSEDALKNKLRNSHPDLITKEYFEDLKEIFEEDKNVQPLVLVKKSSQDTSFQRAVIIGIAHVPFVKYIDTGKFAMLRNYENELYFFDPELIKSPFGWPLAFEYKLDIEDCRRETTTPIDFNFDDLHLGALQLDCKGRNERGVLTGDLLHNTNIFSGRGNKSVIEKIKRNLEKHHQMKF